MTGRAHKEARIISKWRIRKDNAEHVRRLREKKNDERSHEVEVWMGAVQVQERRE